MGETYIFLGRVTDAAVGGRGGRLGSLRLLLLLPLLLGQAALPGEGHLAHTQGLALILLHKLFHHFQLVLQKSAAARGVLVVDGELVHELAPAVEGALGARHRLLLFGDELHVLQALGRGRPSTVIPMHPRRDPSPGKTRAPQGSKGVTLWGTPKRGLNRLPLSPKS